MVRRPSVDHASEEYRVSRRTRSTLVAGLSAVALIAGAATTLAALPAEAVATLTQTKTCVDGGGTRWTVKSTWGRVYTDRFGDRRVQNDITGFTTDSSRVSRVDYILWIYDPDGKRIQDLRQSNRRFDFRDGTAYLKRDVRNPISGAGKTKIKVKVGDGGDGRSKCSVVFTQPGGSAPPRPTPSLNYDQVWTTGYTWHDNSPRNSAAIAHPVIHGTAGGVGTYRDPITLAVAYKGKKPQFPYGTRFYLPKWKKYFIVEDICGACDRVPKGAEYKIDLWLDARNLDRELARKCTYRNTGAHTAVKNPPSGLAVDTRRIC